MIDGLVLAVKTLLKIDLDGRCAILRKIAGKVFGIVVVAMWQQHTICCRVIVVHAINSKYLVKGALFKVDKAKIAQRRYMVSVHYLLDSKRGLHFALRQRFKHLPRNRRP